MGLFPDDAVDYAARLKLAQPILLPKDAEDTFIVAGHSMHMPPEIVTAINNMFPEVAVTSLDQYRQFERSFAEPLEVPDAARQYFADSKRTARAFRAYVGKFDSTIPDMDDDLRCALKEFAQLPVTRAACITAVAHVGELSIDGWSARYVGRDRIGVCTITDTRTLTACFVESAHPNLQHIRLRVCDDHPLLSPFSQYDVAFHAASPPMKQYIQAQCGATPDVMLLQVSKSNDGDSTVKAADLVLCS